MLKGFTEERILGELSSMIGEFKDWSATQKMEFSKAVLDEVRISQRHTKLKDPFLRHLLSYPRAGVKMGEFGVGSRGEGDFFVHRKLAEIIGETGAIVDARDQDDAGVIASERGNYIALAVDGMHSRLSEFPFLAGFHAARASLRDIYVMGARPRALLSDLHLADDGDIGKLFDFTAGVSAVAEGVGAPLVAGSTLRIGGDMVLGDRLVGAVAAVGTAREAPKARRRAEVGDAILATEGSGGGTVATIAIYNGYFDLVKETLNLDFARSCEELMASGTISKVHAMTDVTNGGIRGDAAQISRVTGKKLVFYEDELEKMVNPKVMRMLDELDIDPMGISTDSLVLIMPKEESSKVSRVLRKVAKVYEVGSVEKGKGSRIVSSSGRERDFKPRFRESAYTKVKKVVGEGPPKDFKEMRLSIVKAKRGAQRKKEEIIGLIRGNRGWRKREL